MSHVKNLMGRSSKKFKQKKPMWGAHTGNMSKVTNPRQSSMLSKVKRQNNDDSRKGLVN